MRSAEIDAWVQRIAERTAAGHQNEDMRVELKKEWPSSHEEAAWRIAGHANAARGESVLWVIGLGPDGSVQTPPHNELANWWQQVQKHFDDGIAPTMRDVVVPLATGGVVALLFDTEAAPFVIKGGKHNFEVPYREGVRVDGARRRHLTRLLAPLARLPTIETVRCVLRLVHARVNGAVGLELSWTLFAAPAHIQEPAFAVVHRSYVSISYLDGVELLERSQPPFTSSMPVTSGSLMLNIPRELELGAAFERNPDLVRREEPVRAVLSLAIAGIDRPIVVDEPLDPGEDPKRGGPAWVSR
jgi:hypothetical protein